MVLEGDGLYHWRESDGRGHWWGVLSETQTHTYLTGNYINPNGDQGVQIFVWPKPESAGRPSRHGTRTSRTSKAGKPRPRLSLAARKRTAAAQRKRWAEFRKRSAVSNHSLACTFGRIESGGSASMATVNAPGLAAGSYPRPKMVLEMILSLLPESRTPAW